MQIRNFLLSASSFGRDHSELDSSREDDDDAHSGKWINIFIYNLSTYLLINTNYS